VSIQIMNLEFIWFEPISSFDTAALVVAMTSETEALCFHQLYVTIPPPDTTKLHKGQYTSK
jgi:hypothetical protein